MNNDIFQAPAEFHELSGLDLGQFTAEERAIILQVAARANQIEQVEHTKIKKIEKEIKNYAKPNVENEKRTTNNISQESPSVHPHDNQKPDSRQKPKANSVKNKVHEKIHYDAPKENGKSTNSSKVSIPQRCYLCSEPANCKSTDAKSQEGKCSSCKRIICKNCSVKSLYTKEGTVLCTVCSKQRQLAARSNVWLDSKNLYRSHSVDIPPKIRDNDAGKTLYHLSRHRRSYSEGGRPTKSDFDQSTAAAQSKRLSWITNKTKNSRASLGDQKDNPKKDRVANSKISVAAALVRQLSTDKEVLEMSIKKKHEDLNLKPDDSFKSPRRSRSPKKRESIFAQFLPDLEEKFEGENNVAVFKQPPLVLHRRQSHGVVQKVKSGENENSSVEEEVVKKNRSSSLKTAQELNNLSSFCNVIKKENSKPESKVELKKLKTAENKKINHENSKKHRMRSRKKSGEKCSNKHQEKTQTVVTENVKSNEKVTNKLSNKSPDKITSLINEMETSKIKNNSNIHGIENTDSKDSFKEKTCDKSQQAKPESMVEYRIKQLNSELKEKFKEPKKESSESNVSTVSLQKERNQVENAEASNLLTKSKKNEKDNGFISIKNTMILPDTKIKQQNILTHKTEEPSTIMTNPKKQDETRTSVKKGDDDVLAAEVRQAKNKKLDKEHRKNESTFTSVDEKRRKELKVLENKIKDPADTIDEIVDDAFRMTRTDDSVSQKSSGSAVAGLFDNEGEGNFDHLLDLQTPFNDSIDNEKNKIYKNDLDSDKNTTQNRKINSSISPSGNRTGVISKRPKFRFPDNRGITEQPSAPTNRKTVMKNDAKNGGHFVENERSLQSVANNSESDITFGFIKQLSDASKQQIYHDGSSSESFNLTSNSLGFNANNFERSIAPDIDSEEEFLMDATTTLPIFPHTPKQAVMYESDEEERLEDPPRPKPRKLANMFIRRTTSTDSFEELLKVSDSPRATYRPSEASKPVRGRKSIPNTTHSLHQSFNSGDKITRRSSSLSPHAETNDNKQRRKSMPDTNESSSSLRTFSDPLDLKSALRISEKSKPTNISTTKITQPKSVSLNTIIHPKLDIKAEVNNISTTSDMFINSFTNCFACKVPMCTKQSTMPVVSSVLDTNGETTNIIKAPYNIRKNGTISVDSSTQVTPEEETKPLPGQLSLSDLRTLKTLIDALNDKSDLDSLNVRGIKSMTVSKTNASVGNKVKEVSNIGLGLKRKRTFFKEVCIGTDSPPSSSDKPVFPRHWLSSLNFEIKPDINHRHANTQADIMDVPIQKPIPMPIYPNLSFNSAHIPNPGNPYIPSAPVDIPQYNAYVNSSMYVPGETQMVNPMHSNMHFYGQPMYRMASPAYPASIYPNPNIYNLKQPDICNRQEGIIGDDFVFNNKQNSKNKNRERSSSPILRSVSRRNIYSNSTRNKSFDEDYYDESITSSEESEDELPKLPKFTFPKINPMRKSASVPAVNAKEMNGSNESPMTNNRSRRYEENKRSKYESKNNVSSRRGRVCDEDLLENRLSDRKQNDFRDLRRSDSNSRYEMHSNSSRYGLDNPRYRYGRKGFRGHRTSDYYSDVEYSPPLYSRSHSSFSTSLSDRSKRQLPRPPRDDEFSWRYHSIKKQRNIDPVKLRSDTLQRNDEHLEREVIRLQQTMDDLDQEEKELDLRLKYLEIGRNKRDTILSDFANESKEIALSSWSSSPSKFWLRRPESKNATRYQQENYSGKQDIGRYCPKKSHSENIFPKRNYDIVDDVDLGGCSGFLPPKHSSDEEDNSKYSRNFSQSNYETRSKISHANYVTTDFPVIRGNFDVYTSKSSRHNAKGYSTKDPILSSSKYSDILKSPEKYYDDYAELAQKTREDQLRYRNSSRESNLNDDYDEISSPRNSRERKNCKQGVKPKHIEQLIQVESPNSRSVVSDSEAYDLGRESIDWFKKPL